MKVSVSFQQGKQNQDIDERFITNGEYRELINGRVLDSDTENSGCITSLSGTQVMFNESGLIKHGYKAIATTAHEDLLYVFFSHDFFGNVIVEYDTINRKSQVVFVDGDISLQACPELFLYLAGEVNFQDPFKRFTKINPSSDVTMHVFEGMLFFHDREDEPFKINIERAKELNYYTSREQITVAKMPPFSPRVEITKSGDLEVQEFNLGDYKFASRFVYDDGEVSAISPLSTMPVNILKDLTSSNVPSRSGNISVNESVFKGYLSITEKSIVDGYSIRINTDFGGIDSHYISSFSFNILDRQGNSVGPSDYTSMLMFQNLRALDRSSGVFYLHSKNKYQAYPVIMSASASRKHTIKDDWNINGVENNENDDVIAFITNSRQGADTFELDGFWEDDNYEDQSRLFIYYVKEKQGYFEESWNGSKEGRSHWGYQSVHVTRDGDVYVSCYNKKQYFLTKFDKENKRLVRVIGSDIDTNVSHRVAKPHTIASNYTGNTIYYVCSRFSDSKSHAVNLFQSIKSGHKSSFRLLATRDLMFADTLTYINEYKGDDQNRWNVSCCCSADGLIVYVGCCNCIARSDDGGQTWRSYVIDQENITYGAVIDLKCSANGKYVYAVVGVGDNEYNNNATVEDDDSVTDNNYPVYSGNLYASMSYGKQFRKVYLNANTFYNIDTPTFGRVRSVICNDDGDTILAEGFIWGYFKGEGNEKYNLTDYPNSGKVIFPTTSLFMSSDYGFNMYATSWGQGLPATGGVALSMINGYYPESGQLHGFSDKMDLNEMFRNQCISYSAILMAQTLPLSDVKYEKIENDVSEVELTVQVPSDKIKYIEMLLNHNGTYYSIQKIPYTDTSKQNVSIKFNNNGLLSVIPSKDANKLYDNVPLKVNSSNIAQNTLMFGGYTDGYNSFSVDGIVVKNNEELFNVGDIGLKSNTYYKYAILAFDKYNRSASPMPIGSISTSLLRTNKKNVAQIIIPNSYEFPSWVSHFKFCRTKLKNNYYVINGFDDAIVFGDKILLDVTSNTNIVPEIGDTLEVIYDYYTKSNPFITFTIIGYIDNKSGVYEGEVERDEIILNESKRYILIKNNIIDGYDKTAVVSGDSRFVSSVFYINSTSHADKIDDVYYEIPYTFNVVDGKPGEEIFRDDIFDGKYTYTLKDDGDIILYDNPCREVNILNDGKRFTTLGRIALYSENNKQQYRKASICASEPYVQDTGFNGLSSFNTALVNYKDLDTQYGDIEAIDGMEDRIAVFQKYRCSQLQYKKHILSTATGDALVSKTQDIFGEQVFYALEYGLTDHHSLVKWGNSRFFVDQKRGAVLRIDYNGIHNISNNGMRNYFHKSLENYKGKIMACYDVAHSSYMLFHIVNGKMVCDNYYTPVDGWSAKFEIDPDIIINTMNGVFSFKNQLLYKHDVTPYPSIYGEYKDITIKIPCNENPLIIKNYTAIQVDSTTSPYFGRFITRQGESLVGSVDFEKTEMEYQSYIPMVNGVIASNPVFCCVVEKDTKGDDVKFKINSTVDIHNDDAVLVCMDNGEGVYEPIGATYRIKELTPSEMTVEGDIDIPAGAILMAVDESQINGHAHKDTSMMVELRFTSATVVKSITMDINESKI